VNDLYIHPRDERALPFLFALVGAVTAWGMLELGSAPLLLIVLAARAFTLLVVFVALSLGWKAAGFAVLIWGTLEQSLLPAGIAPLVVWSRIRLNRRLLVQSVAGLLLGAALFTIAFALARNG
jgi:hypothetical protein